MQLQSIVSKPVIKMGERIYSPLNWTRRDDIYLDGKRIGHIKLSRENRTGTTYSTVSGKRTPGRAADWCVEQAMLRTHGLDHLSTVDLARIPALCHLRHQTVFEPPLSGKYCRDESLFILK